MTVDCSQIQPTLDVFAWRGLCVRVDAESGRENDKTKAQTIVRAEVEEVLVVRSSYCCCAAINSCTVYFIFSFHCRCHPSHAHSGLSFSLFLLHFFRPSLPHSQHVLCFFVFSALAARWHGACRDDDDRRGAMHFFAGRPFTYAGCRARCTDSYALCVVDTSQLRVTNAAAAAAAAAFIARSCIYACVDLFGG